MSNYGRSVDLLRDNETRGNGKQPGGRAYIPIGENCMRKDIAGDIHTGRRSKSSYMNFGNSTRTPAWMNAKLNLLQRTIDENRENRKILRASLLARVGPANRDKLKIDLQSDDEEDLANDPENQSYHRRRDANAHSRHLNILRDPAYLAQSVNPLPLNQRPPNLQRNQLEHELVGHGVVKRHPLHNAMEF